MQLLIAGPDCSAPQYTCYWYPAASRPGSTPSPGSRVGSCAPGSAHCSAHGFSATGEAGSWTWLGGDEAPYNFTAEDSSGGTRLFSTRERPWGLLGGVHGDEWQVLINGVSGLENFVDLGMVLPEKNLSSPPPQKKKKRPWG